MKTNYCTLDRATFRFLDDKKKQNKKTKTKTKTKKKTNTKKNYIIIVWQDILTKRNFRKLSLIAE